MNIEGIKPIEPKKIQSGSSPSKSEGPGFSEVLKGFMQDVNDLQLKADDKIEKLATGEIKDVHEVMIAMSEADTSFGIMMDMRNKLMAVYKEMMKMGGS